MRQLAADHSVNKFKHPASVELLATVLRSTDFAKYLYSRNLPVAKPVWYVVLLVLLTCSCKIACLVCSPRDTCDVFGRYDKHQHSVCNKQLYSGTWKVARHDSARAHRRYCSKLQVLLRGKRNFSRSPNCVANPQVIFGKRLVA